MPTPEHPSDQWRTADLQLPKGSASDSKWETWVRIFLSFLLGGFSAAFFLGGKSRNVDELLVWKGEIQTEVRSEFKNIYSRLDRMDANGTNRSHWVDEQQSSQIAANVSAIADIRAKAEARGEVMGTMQYKIERIEGELKDAKTRGH